MPPIRVRLLHSALLRMGFVPENRKDVYYFHTLNGGRTGVRTKMSHGETEVGEHLLHKMARQLYLSRSELDEFVSGRMTNETYLRILREKGVRL